MTQTEKYLIEVTDGVFIQREDLGGAEVECLFEELHSQGITPHFSIGMPMETHAEDLWERSSYV